MQQLASFSADMGDVIGLDDILETTLVPDDLSDVGNYITSTVSAAGTTLYFDPTGQGLQGSAFAVLQGVDTTVAQLVADGAMQYVPDATTAIATNGTTILAQVGNRYELNPAGGGTGPLLELNGRVVTAGQFPAGWTPVGAEQTANGYEVAWSVPGANEYEVWNTGSNGDYTSAAAGILSGTSLSLRGWKPTSARTSPAPSCPRRRPRLRPTA